MVRPQEMAESQRLVTALKRELKVRGMTYRQLAEGLGLAESTIKRSFASGRLDFERLDAICELLSLQLEASDAGAGVIPGG